jgi:hypothetical protein
MTTTPSQYSYYRWNFLKRTVFPVFVLPLILTLFEYRALSLFDSLEVSGLRALKWILYPLTLVLYNVFRVQYDDWFHRREAGRLGARLVPRVEGKWIGNLDLLLKKDPKIPYLGQRLEDMFDELDTKTLNMRILWTDNVGNVPIGVLRSVFTNAHSGYHHG